MKITIEVIPHDQQRYSTCGDWKIRRNGNIEILVSSMGDWKKEMLVGLHEMVEVLLCKNRGITDEIVSAFDIQFEKDRPEGNTDEPGDDPKAPYRREHFFATNLERLMAAELGVDWHLYDAAVNGLP